MTIRIDTGSGFLSPKMDIHIWWRNFLDQSEGDGWDSYEDIDATLAKYNARFIRYIDRTVPDQVEFKSEADMMLFILRWS